MGAGIVLIARDKTRADATLARLRDNAPGFAHAIYLADLLRLAEMKRVAAQVAEHGPRIDVLINNAGRLFATRRLTEDGLERTFALNHMAYFVVTEGLRERLLDSRPARIINTASAAHQGATLDFNDLQSAKSFGAVKAYRRSNLCNILFTRELARRLDVEAVTANCLHPGFVTTRGSTDDARSCDLLAAAGSISEAARQLIQKTHHHAVASRSAKLTPELGQRKPEPSKRNRRRHRAARLPPASANNPIADLRCLTRARGDSVSGRREDHPHGSVSSLND